MMIDDDGDKDQSNGVSKRDESMEADSFQDIARSSFADMLNDDERNKAFDHGINISVRALVNSKKINPSGVRHFNCCDIGTGSGLLSMMIVRAFKNLNYDHFHVYAFEEFKPMAECAKKVISCNNMTDKITVIPENSVTHKLSSNLHKQFDLLVGELLDTELIGEGCLKTYRHAIQNLCSPHCFFVPHQARIYIEPVASSFLFQRHAVDDLKIDIGHDRTIHLKISDQVRDCCGLSDLDDMQASMLLLGKDITRITESQVVFTFLFNKLDTLPSQDQKVLNFTIKKKVEQPVVVIMWWDITMYDKERVEKACDTIISEQPSLDLYILSCAPTWARDESLTTRDKEIFSIYGREVWREHWIQGVYYFNNVIETRKLIGLETHSQFSIYAAHDGYSLRFELSNTDHDINCICGIHRKLSRAQLSSINSKNEDIIKYIKAILFGKLESSGNLFGQVEFRPFNTNPMSNWSFKLANTTIDRDMINLNGSTPWKNTVHKISTKTNIDPIEKISIKFTQVEFDNLNRIDSSIGDCEGFNLRELDNLIMKARKMADDTIEPHYLWEYGAKRLDIDYEFCDLSDLHDLTAKGRIERTMVLPITRFAENQKKGWALVFWTEFMLKSTKDIISSGPVNRCNVGDYIEWNRYCEQFVHFMQDYPFEDGCKSIEIDLLMNDQSNIEVRRVNGR